MPINSSTRLDEAMAAEMERLSLSSIDSMRNLLDLLADMLQAVNPSDRAASVEDEIIVDLVRQCRSNQKKLMQMLTTTGDEELLGQGLELNDSLQSVLAKHDAIASGSPLPTQATNFNRKSAAETSLKSTHVKEPRKNQDALQIVPVGKAQIEDEEDDFAQLARRHSRTRSTASSQDTSTGTSDSVVTSVNSTVAPVPRNTLSLPDPVRTTQEQVMIDLLSITLSTTTQPPPTPPPSSPQNIPQGYPYPSQTYPGNQGQVPYNSYVVPWAQSQAHAQVQTFHHQPQPPQTQPQPQYLQYSSSGYPPPPWAPTPGYYYSNRNHLGTSLYMNSTPQANTPPASSSVQGAKPLHHVNTFPAKRSNVSAAMNGEELRRMSSSPGTAAVTSSGKKPFVPSYRLFEDLNVLGNGEEEEGMFKMTNNTSSGLSGASSQSTVGGRK